MLESEERLLEYRILYPQAFVQPPIALPLFVWSGKAVWLIELIYALHQMRCINGGDAGIGELTEYVCAMFGIEVKDPCGAYGDIKRRKADSRTYFLDQLRERLTERMERDDEK